MPHLYLLLCSDLCRFNNDLDPNEVIHNHFLSRVRSKFRKELYTEKNRNLDETVRVYKLMIEVLKEMTPQAFET